MILALLIVFLKPGTFRFNEFCLQIANFLDVGLLQVLVVASENLILLQDIGVVGVELTDMRIQLCYFVLLYCYLRLQFELYFLNAGQCAVGPLAKGGLLAVGELLAEASIFEGEE